MATSTITQMMNNSDSGYCKMPDGTLMQWGYKANSSGAGVVDYDIPFIDTPPFVMACPRYASGSTDGSYHVLAQAGTKSKLNIYFRTSSGTGYTGTGSAFWLAIGRWK